MEIKFDVYFKKNLGTLCKDNEVDLDGKEAYVNIDLNLVDRLEVNYSVGGTKYTDEVIMKDIEAKEILIPFKSDVVKKGLNEFEVVAYMKNGDIKVSQTYTYNIEKGIGEGQQASDGGSSNGHTHNNLTVLNTITQAKVNEWNNKADRNHTHSEYASATHSHSNYASATHSHSEYASKSHNHNVSEIEGLENVDIDLSDYYTRSETDEAVNNKADKVHTHSEYLTEHQDISHKADKADTYTKTQTDNKISEEIAKAQLGGDNKVDLSAYATKTFVNEEIAKIELKEGPQGPQGIQGPKGETGEQGIQGEKGEKGEKGVDGLTTSISVNGNTYNHVEGTITLPNYPTVPTKTSELTNDSGFATDLSGLGADLSLNGQTLKLKNSNGTEIGTGVTLPQTSEGIMYEPIYEGDTLSSWNALGDSITYGSGTTKTYDKFIKEEMSIATVNNYGISGTEIAHGTWPNPMSERYTNMQDNVDLISVFGGVNDFLHGNTLGVFSDRVNTTFYGALHVLCNGLKEKYPNGKIFFITPLKMRWGTFEINSDGTNKLGLLLDVYVDAIKEVCKYYSIPVLDLNSLEGFDPNIDDINSTYFADGLHPNLAGHRYIYPHIMNFIKYLFSAKVILKSEDNPIYPKTLLSNVFDNNNQDLQSILDSLFARIELLEQGSGSVTPVESITLNETNLTVKLNKTSQLSATVLPSEAPQSVVWSANNSNVNVSQDGLVTGVSVGSCTITCKSEYYPNIFATCQVTIAEDVTVTPEDCVLSLDTTSGSGNTIQDSVGKKVFNLTNFGNGGTSGWNSGYLTFDGTNDVLKTDVGATDVIAGIKDGTGYSVVVKLKLPENMPTSGWHRLFTIGGKSGGVNNYGSPYFFNTNLIMAGYGKNPTILTDISSLLNVEMTLVFVFDKSNGKLLVYKDGSKLYDSNYAFSSVSVDSDDITIGGHYGVGDCLGFDLYGFEIYNKVLSTDEMLSL